MKLHFSLLGVLLFSAVVFSSCGKDKAGYWSQDEQNAKDRQLIEDYVSANNLSGQFTDSGLYYIIIEPGTEEKPVGTSRISVHYKGYYLDNVTFDEGNLSDIYLSNLIKGWQEGIPYFKVGGSGKLLIPSALGYGTQGSGSIPPNSVLIFNIELIEVL